MNVQYLRQPVGYSAAVCKSIFSILTTNNRSGRLSVIKSEFLSFEKRTESVDLNKVLIIWRIEDFSYFKERLLYFIYLLSSF